MLFDKVTVILDVKNIDLYFELYTPGFCWGYINRTLTTITKILLLRRKCYDDND